MKVFIYGTLKRGFPLFDKGLVGADYLGDVETVERYPLYIAGSFYGPMMLDRAGEGLHVRGELFEVEEDRLSSRRARRRRRQNQLPQYRRSCNGRRRDTDAGDRVHEDGEVASSASLRLSVGLPGQTVRAAVGAVVVAKRLRSRLAA